jgi:hypothetical protein
VKRVYRYLCPSPRPSPLKGRGRLIVLLLAFVASPASAQQRPKSVLQIGHPGQLWVWAWSADSRYLLTFGAAGPTERRELLVWDVAGRAIIDRIDIPQVTIPLDFERNGDDQCAAGGNLQLNLITAGKAGHVRIWFGDNMCRYKIALSFDLKTRILSARQTVAMVPDGVSRPLSPNRAWRVTAQFRNPMVVAMGKARIAPLPLSSPQRAMIAAAISPDGQSVALLSKLDPAKPAVLRLLAIDGLTSHTFAQPVDGLDALQWDGGHRIVAWGQGDGRQPIVAIDAATGAIQQSYEPRCTPAIFAGGMFAQGLRACTGGDEEDLWVATFDRPGWRRAFPELEGLIVTGIVTAAAAPRAVVMACLTNDCVDRDFRVIDTQTMRIIGRSRQSLPDVIAGITLSPDGRHLFVRKEVGMLAFAFPAMIDGAFDLTPEPVDQPVVDLLNGGGGWLPDSGTEWQRIDRNILRFSRARDHKPIAELIALPSGAFTVQTPFGTYDTSGRPDAAQTNWLFPDAPMTSLPIEIFMRDYFEPNLLRRRLDCTLPDSCAKVFRPAPDLASLNRTLPFVRISAVPGPAPFTDRVTVLASDSIIPASPAGRNASGAYNLRVYRDDRLVAQEGRPDSHLLSDDRAGWRTQTMLVAPAAQQTRRFTFDVPWAPDAAKRDIAFTAYAFNDNRVKSRTVRIVRTTPPGAPRVPRLYLLTIGIDSYGTGGFPSLRYAGADARAMADLLKAIRLARPAALPFEIHAESVIGTADQPATRERLRQAFAHLRDARPDDTVVVTYAGHGFTDAQGHFSLVPSDVRRIGDQPDPASLITSGDLSDWLEPVDAGEMAFVIDACHSAASVSAGGFKPGPMGDPGLGQLAYDKGIRILAASQPDQYAMELSSVGHGLLTYALVQQGAIEGKADLDHDGFIRLDEMLHYATVAVQASAAPTLGGEGDAPLVVDWGHDVQPARQKPALFDYVDVPAVAGLKVIRP